MDFHEMRTRARLVGGMLALVLPARAGARPTGQAATATVQVAVALPEAPAAPDAGAPAPARAGACPTGMAEIPGGTFVMGDDRPDTGTGPEHRVTLDSFCLDAKLVTLDEYTRCSTCSHSPPSMPYPMPAVVWESYLADMKKPGARGGCNHAGEGRGDHPKNCVTWDQAMTYCKSLGKTLPTEAQWEYAARGGAEQRKWSIGGAVPTIHTACIGYEPVAGQDHEEKGTCPVGEYPAGAFGLFNMVGNVEQWTADWHGPYGPDPQKNPTGPSSGEVRTQRGVPADSYVTEWANSTARGAASPEWTDAHVGFRCAKAK